MFKFYLKVVGCRQPCFNGGRCVNGACQCQTSYEGPQCRLPVGFDIRIIIPDNLTPMVGDNLAFTCEVGSDGRYQNPVWRDTRGSHVLPAQQGRWFVLYEWDMCSVCLQVTLNPTCKSRLSVPAWTNLHVDLILPYADVCIALHTLWEKNFTGDSGRIRTHDLLLTSADVLTSWLPSCILSMQCYTHVGVGQN